MAARLFLAMVGMDANMMAATSCGIPFPRTATMHIAIMIMGIAWKISMIRMITMSTLPPK